MILAHRKDIVLDGNNPTLVLGYGAYNYPTDLSFELQKLILLNYGFIIAIPQVRGGGDGDQNWHRDGKLMNKKNSFHDFIDCVQYLIDQKYTNSSLVCAKGVSAGGLLVSASALMRPDLFKSILLKVPFLDVTSTMLDKDLPLTELERDEWGDPIQHPEHLQYIQSYSPYEQLSKLSSTDSNNLPHMYLTAAMRDFHVPCWQIFKFVARLWYIQKPIADNDLKQITVLRILDTAHGDEAGKYGTPEDIAAEYAFIFITLGIQPK
jgi:oligopeptidase B